MHAPNAVAVAVLVLLASASGGCRGREQAEPAFTAGHPLAMREAGGSASIDRRIGDLQRRLRREPSSPEAWLTLGEAWVRKAREEADPGLYRSAEDCARAALALARDSQRAHRLLGLVLLEGHRFEEARQLAEALVARAPDDAAAHGILSDALLELGRTDEAARAAQRMMDLKPNLPAYVRASYLLWLRGDVEGALESARLAVDSGGEAESRAWARTQAALLRWSRGDLDGADAELERALAEAPEHAAAMVARGRVALSRRDFAAARAWLERAHRRAPLPETAWLLGDARAASGDEAGAREAYDRVVRDGRAFDRRTLALFLATKDRAPEEAVRLAEAERSRPPRRLHRGRLRLGAVPRRATSPRPTGRRGRRHASGRLTRASSGTRARSASRAAPGGKGWPWCAARCASTPSSTSPAPPRRASCLPSRHAAAR